MWGVLRREVRTYVRNPQQVLNPIAFLLLAVMLFAIAVPQDQLALVGAGILWVLVLLTVVLSLDSLFRRDFDSGVLEQTLIQAAVPFAAILGKLFAHWLVTGGLIVVLSPLLGNLLSIPGEGLGILALTLLCGTPALTLLGGVGAALTVGLNRGGVLLALLILPLLLPVLIFGIGALEEHLLGAPTTAQISWMIFITMLAALVGPFATLAGLKISVQLQ